MRNTIEVYANDGVKSVGVRFENVKPIVLIALGFTLGVLAVNYINNQKTLS